MVLKICVTGATGFLGNNIVKALVEANKKVIATNELNGKKLYDPIVCYGLTGSETKWFPKVPEIKIEFGDITIYEDVERVLQGCDVVVRKQTLFLCSFFWLYFFEDIHSI